MEMLKKVKKLGSGNYATVYLAYSSDGPIAVKSADGEDSLAIEALENEARMLKKLAGAQNIVQCFGEDDSVENNGETYSLLLEYAPLGSLDDFIEKNTPISETKVACYASMLLRGLIEIHSRRFVHCDLKPANILVFPGRNEEIKTLKIADFGSSRSVLEQGLINPDPTWEGSGKTYYNLGTPSEASPESVLTGFHGPCTDVWSIGCIIYQMMTGKSLWEWNEDMEYLYDQILNYPIKFPANISPEGVDFLKGCLDRDRDHRKSAEELLKCPFLTKNKEWIDLMTEDDKHISRNTKPWISTIDLFSESPVEEPVASCFYENAEIDTRCHITSTAR